VVYQDQCGRITHPHWAGKGPVGKVKRWDEIDHGFNVFPVNAYPLSHPIADFAVGFVVGSYENDVSGHDIP
jgi:hypothetical protein